MTETASSGLKGSLGVASIVLMVVATAAPLTVMVANTPLIITLGNGPAAPVDALIAAVIMFMFTVGFVAMSKYINNAGAFYAYIQKGLGRTVGLGSATLALVSYSLILLGLEAFIGYAIADAVNDFIGVGIPWWVYSLATVAVIGYLGYRHIELSSKFLGIALILEIAVVILVNIAIFMDKGPSGMESEPFHLSNVISGSPGLGILFAIFSFIGFESTVIYREEARDTDRTIPRATYTAVIIVGLFYVISMWCEVSGIGSANLQAYSDTHGADMYLALSEQYIGTVMTDLMQVLLITSLFACAQSLHNIVVRYQYTLGRFSVLSPRLSAIHSGHGSPHVSSFVQTLCSLAAFVVLIILGADPAGQIYAWGAMAGTLGYMAILSLTCAAVIVFFTKQQPGGFWTTRVAPALGLVGVLGCLWIAIDNLPSLIGGEYATAVSIIVVLFMAATFVFGFLAAQVIRLRKPDRYNALSELA